LYFHCLLLPSYPAPTPQELEALARPAFRNL
jgi:hypothetical protein